MLLFDLGIMPMFGLAPLVAGLIVGLTTTLAGAGLAYAMRPDQPGAPGTTGYKEGVETEAALLPYQRMIERAARMGEKVAVEIPGQTMTETQQVPYVQVDKRDPTGRRTGTRQLIPYVESEWQEGGKYYKPGVQPKIVHKTETVTIPYRKELDFTGLGEAEVQSAYMDAMAQIQLDLQDKYGSQFVDEAKRQLELADPESAEGRKLLYDMIQGQIEREPDRPVADLLDKQVLAKVQAGEGLTDSERDLLTRATTEAQAARGNKADVDPSQRMTTGFAGETRAMEGLQNSIGWLSSGSTPEDVAHRREQQNLANLGAYVSGNPVTAQFQSLSGAQSGAAPMASGRPMSTMNPNAGTAGQNYATQKYGLDMAALQNSPNDWMAGLGLAFQAAGVAGDAGWQPFAPKA